MPSAKELVLKFYEHVDNDPASKLRRYLSYGHGRKIVMALDAFGDPQWNEVASKTSEITSWMQTNASFRGGRLSDRTVDLAWTWLARAFDYAVGQGGIPVNPFSDMVPGKKALSRRAKSKHREEPVDKENSKHEKFKRIATRRTRLVIQKINAIGKLSSGNYVYSNDDVDKIFNAIQKSVDEVKMLFSKKISKSNQFEL